MFIDKEDFSLVSEELRKAYVKRVVWLLRILGKSYICSFIHPLLICLFVGDVTCQCACAGQRTACDQFTPTMWVLGTAAPQLRAHTALVEDLSLFPAPTLSCSQPPITPGDLSPSSDF